MRRLVIALCLMSVIHAVPTQADQVVRQPRPYDPNRRLPELSFENNSLADIVDFFRDVCNAQIAADWTALSTIDVEKEASITLRVKNKTLPEALQIIVDKLGSNTKPAFYDDGNLIVISTNEAINRCKAFDKAHPAAKTGLDQPLFNEREIVATGDQSLENVFADLSAKSSLRFQVDWKSLASVGLSRDITVLNYSHNGTAREQLKLILLGLSKPKISAGLRTKRCSSDD